MLSILGRFILTLLLVTAFILLACEKVLGKTALVDDFDSGEMVNYLGGEIGVWNRDPEDKTQKCEIAFSEKVKFGKHGYSLEINYDVDSPNPAYNGVWIKLKGFDAHQYDFLIFQVRGPTAKEIRHTDKFKVELKGSGGSGEYLVKGIRRGSWKTVKVPLRNLSGLKDLNSLNELVIVFDDHTIREKTGVLYIDNIYFSDGEILFGD